MTSRQVLTNFINTAREAKTPLERAWGEQMACANKYDLNRFPDGLLPMTQLARWAEMRPELFAPPGGNLLTTWWQGQEEGYRVFCHIAGTREEGLIARCGFQLSGGHFTYPPCELRIDPKHPGVRFALANWFISTAKPLKTKAKMRHLGALWQASATALITVGLGIEAGRLPAQNGHLSILSGGPL